MASFPKKLDDVLKDAEARGVVSPEQSASLLDIGREHDRRTHVSGLAAILGWLGGGVVVVGIILLISANWESIPGLAKVGGFLVLFAAAHGGGLYIRWKNIPWPFTASALHFIGAGLFIAGIGLIAQVYNLHDRLPNGVLMWLIAVAPLAVLLESAPIAVMSIVAALVWAHMEGSFPGSPLQMPDMAACHFIIEVGVGAALVGLAGLVRRTRPSIAAAMSVCGLILVAGLLYIYGFYRYWSDDFGGGRYYWYHWSGNSNIYLPYAALAIGALGLAFGWRGVAPASRALRATLLALLGLTLVLAAAAAATDLGMLPRGPVLDQWEFGWSSHHDVAEWLITIGAWALWFALSTWCLVYGTMARTKALVNLGVIGIGLGVVTRFFDLAGGLASTGWIFVIGGAVLLGTGWAMEKWRRSLVHRMEGRP